MANGEYGAFACVDSEKQYLQKGLTKREYFAGLAMQGMLSNPGAYGSDEILVMLSVKKADLLLKELEK